MYAQTKVNEWEDIVFDFSSITGTYPIIALMPDFNDPVDLDADITLYFDDIIVNNNPDPITGTNFTISGNTNQTNTILTYTGGTTTSNQNGDYFITVDSGWSGTVTPSKAGYVFSPVQKSYSNLSENAINQDYSATVTATTYSISGNTGVEGALITWADGTTTSNVNGDYSITIPFGWSGAVTPTFEGYRFNPTEKVYVNVITNQVSQDFTAISDASIVDLFQSSYKLYSDIRLDNGIYLDALAINAQNKPASIVACGVGLVSLAIADAMYQKTGDAANWEPNAAAKTLETMQTLIDFKNNGHTNGTGMFHRYFNQNTGGTTGSWTGEYSTADNAIFAFGLIICKNYFSNNASVVNAANLLLIDMDFTAAIGSTNIAMVLDEAGYGQIAFTIPWNEYMMVAWLAKNSNPAFPGYAKSQTFWNTYFANPKTAPVNHPVYNGFELLSDGGFCSTFTIQFCYYYINYFRNNVDYMWYFNNWMNADNQFQGGETYEWGLGAGEVPGGGYSADKINGNPNNIVSPQIIAGFIPIYDQSKPDLKSLYDGGNGPAVYNLPSNPAKKVLWRYSQSNHSLRTPYIQAVDFSTMLYGLASLPEFLGPDWFNDHNAVNFPTSVNESVGRNISIFPNPVTQTLFVNLGDVSSAKLEIFGISGQLIYITQLNNTSGSIDVSRLIYKGLAIVKITTKSGASSFKIQIK
jgi:hypothetical protein